MLSLLSLLQTPRDWPGRLLAERLDVSLRTVRRDVDRLRGLGYRIAATKGPDGGYRLSAGSELPPLLFDDAQAVAIAVALRSSALTGVDIEEGAQRALATVRQVMPSRLRHRVDGIAFDRPQSEALVDPAVLDAVSGAVRERRVLRFEYGGSDDPPRRVEPHALAARGGRWYLVAWDLEREDWRLFRLDRMAPRTPTGPRCAPRALPTRDAAAFVAARVKGTIDDTGWPCVGEVIIELPAREVAPWIGDGEFEELTPTSCRLRLGSWSWTALLALVARWDAPFRIVGPEPFVAASAALARRLQAAAGSGP